MVNYTNKIGPGIVDQLIEVHLKKDAVQISCRNICTGWQSGSNYTKSDISKFSYPVEDEMVLTERKKLLKKGNNVINDGKSNLGEVVWHRSRQFMVDLDGVILDGPRRLIVEFGWSDMGQGKLG